MSQYEIVDSITKAIQHTFPDLIVYKTYNGMNSPYTTSDRWYTYITIKVDLKPFKNTPSMPTFERKIWVAEIGFKGDNIIFMISKACHASDAYEYQLEDPQSLNKLYTVLYWHYQNIKKLLRNRRFPMLPVGCEPTDNELQAELARMPPPKIVKILNWDLNVRNQ